jgi:hypothetical protein
MQWILCRYLLLLSQRWQSSGAWRVTHGKQFISFSLCSLCFVIRSVAFRALLHLEMRCGSVSACTSTAESIVKRRD